MKRANKGSTKGQYRRRPSSSRLRPVVARLFFRWKPDLAPRIRIPHRPRCLHLGVRCNRWVTRSPNRNSRRERDVVMADIHLVTFDNLAPLMVQSSVHGGFARVTDSFDLDEFLCPAQKIFAPLKGLPSKISSQSITQHGNVEFVTDQSQLKHLGGCQKLSFINQNAINRTSTLSISNCNEQVCVAIEGVRFGL